MSVAVLDRAAPPVTLGRRRAKMLALLGAALAVCWWLLVVAHRLPQTPFWSSSLFPLFDFVVALKCLEAARTQTGHDRKAWLCFALACFSFGLGEAIWAIYEVHFGIHVPVRSLADAGYIASTLLFILGILLHHDPARSRALTYVQVGNLGIIFSAILLGYTFVFQGILDEAGSLEAAVVEFIYGIGTMAALAFGLVVVSLHGVGQRRVALTLIVAGLSCLSVTYFTFTYSVLENTYTGANPVNLLYLASFAFVYWAAFERQHLPIDGASKFAPTPDEKSTGGESWAVGEPTSVAGGRRSPGLGLQLPKPARRFAVALRHGGSAALHRLPRRAELVGAQCGITPAL